MRYVCFFCFLMVSIFPSFTQTCFDPTFADNGIKNYWDNTDESGIPYIQEDGSILILGVDLPAKKIQWRKLFPNGSEDLSFGAGGVYEYPLEDFLPSRYYKRTDGTLIIDVFHSTDKSANYLKLKKDLSIDSSYGENGIARIKKYVDSEGVKSWKDWNFDIRREELQPDGKILIAGITGIAQDTLIMTRFTADGHIDSVFGNKGYHTYYCGAYPYVSGISTTVDGRIIVSGSSKNESSAISQLFLRKFHPDGTPDSSLNHTGILHTNLGLIYGFPYIYGLQLQPDGKILVTGSMGVPLVARFNPDGIIDSTFNGKGYSILPDSFSPKTLFLQGGKILVLGEFGDVGRQHYGMARLLSDGSIDSSFCDNGIFQYKPEVFRTVGISARIVHKEHIYILGGVSMPLGDPNEQYAQLLKVNISVGESESDNLCGMLYPNPTTGEINIRDTSVFGAYTIYDNLGKSVSEGILNPDGTVNVGMLPDAVYYIVVQSREKELCRYKFIKQ